MAEHQVSVDKDPLLAFCDPNLDTKLSTDASRYGLDDTLFKRHGVDWRPIAHNSRVLTEAETRYSLIEKETPKVVYGCEMFYDFLYRNVFTIETNHSKKYLANMPLRLQRLFLRLIKYDYHFHFIHGRQLVLADTLSRAPIPGNTSLSYSEVEVDAVSVVSSLVTEAACARLKQERPTTPCLRP